MKKPTIKNSGISIVSGFSLTIVRIGVALAIMRVSLQVSKNPFKAIFLLRSLIKERIAIHENTGGIKAVRSGGKYYWSVNIPGWPSETFDHFVRNEFLRINSPELSHLQTIIFAITNVCPLNCIHCYEADNLSSENKLSLNELKLIMKKIDENGIRHVQFSGGEPLSRIEDMIELMRFSGGKSDFWINTSGFGLTAEKARIMKQNGMTGAIISLDDWDESRHNAFRRNNKSFFWVQEAVRNCKNAGLVVCLSVCATKEFVSEENLIVLHLLAKNMGAGFLRIFEPRKAGRFAEKDVLLSADQISIIHKFVFSRNTDLVYKDYPIIQFPGHYQRKSGCMGAGNRYLYIDANGDFHNCPFCRNPLGNVLNKSIEEGIANARASGCHEFKQRVLV